ncbi:MAG: hypothetical protein CME06_11455 [Gemmatimonadetes bacterium]|nr:hypothetical protein [Gemmatimonadota bacterium]
MNLPELDDPRVASISVGDAGYPARPPFHPAAPYPELRRLRGGSAPSLAEAGGNAVYEAVRELFRRLEMDGPRFGSIDWNPLGEVIRPGETVVVKPNWVKESHLLRPDDWEEVITHPSVIRAVVDYALLALGESGRIIITDGPQTDSSFRKIVQRTSMGALIDHWRSLGLGPDVELLDLRQEEHLTRDGVIVRRTRLEGDPLGYVEYDLGEGSELVGHKGRYFGACFDMDETNRAHSGGVHRYRISGTVAHADVVLNIPKMKTHKKCGITASLKNMVGINGWKNFLPHHSEGTPRMGGDQFPDDSLKGVLEYHLMGRFKAFINRCPDGVAAVLRHLKKPGRAAFGDTEEVVRSGNWYGNDTIWRMVLDLNKLLLYGDRHGELRSKPVRRYFSIVDGIVAGEGNGPMCPEPVAAGRLIGGRNAVAVDQVCAVEMGLDPRKIPSIDRARACRTFPLARFDAGEVSIVRGSGATEPTWTVDPARKYRFVPHFGWAGHVELEGPIGPEGFAGPVRHEAGTSRSSAGLLSATSGEGDFG